MLDQMQDRGFYDDLDATLEEAWRRLARGAADRRSEFHTVQLATLGLDGAPRLRTVVLRGVEREARRLRAHTDRRSGKAAELAAEPRVALHAYDSRAKIQLRLRGRARLHVDDDAAAAAWAATQGGSRSCYRGLPPGQALAAPGDGDPTQAMRSPQDPEAGRENFAALLFEAESLEWLYLAARGHRRALFDWAGGEWRGRWLAP
jgi:hypothetical protein